MTKLHADRRLFVPLRTAPFDWFSSQGKKWEVRRNRGAFRADRLTCGRRVELRRGYTGTSLWGTLTKTVSAANAAELFSRVEYPVAVPTVTSKAEAIALVEKLLGKDQELVAFRVDLDEERAVQDIPFDPDLIGLLDLGKKTTTIRAGHRDYQPGPAVLHFGPNTRRDAAIIGTRLTTLDALTVHDARTDGYDTTDELAAVLRRFYPSLGADAPVTVVEFTCRPD